MSLCVQFSSFPASLFLRSDTCCISLFHHVCFQQRQELCLVTVRKGFSIIKQRGTFNVRSLLWLFVSGFSSIILQQGVFTASSLTATKTTASSVKDISSSRESCCHGNADPCCTGLTCQVKPGQSEPAHEDKTPSTVL